MKVTIACNFPADERLGSPKIALREADELEKLGVQVDRVFREEIPGPRDGRAGSLSAPARVTAALVSRAGDSDVVDIAGGDGFLYAQGARRFRPRQAVVARSNGLWVRALVADGELPRSALRAAASSVFQREIFCRWEAASIREATWARVLSSPDADDIAARGWKPREHISVVNPGADGTFDTDTPLDGRVGVAFLGSWITRKGTEVTARAMSRLLSERPALRFSVLGSSTPAERVRADFDPAVRERVTVLEKATPPELARAAAEHAVLLFPTRYEGFGLVVIEAMLSGLAVVTTRTGAGADAVRDGESGLLIAPDDAVGAEAAVRRLLDDDELRRRVAEAGRRESRTRTWRRSGEELLACYEAALRLARNHAAA